VASDRKFPTWALVVLIVCVVAIAGVAVLFLFSHAFNPSSKSISIAQAKQSADNYIAGSPDLKVAEIGEYANNFYVRVKERSSGINAFELLVDRTSGAVTREPSPDMMWNAKYGMMGFGRGPTADMPVSAGKATDTLKDGWTRTSPEPKRGRQIRFMGTIRWTYWLTVPHMEC
jgi:hypothetical protein